MGETKNKFFRLIGNNKNVMYTIEGWVKDREGVFDERSYLYLFTGVKVDEICEIMLRAAYEIAEKLKADRIFVYADFFDNTCGYEFEKYSDKPKVILGARTMSAYEKAKKITDDVLFIPSIDLTRIGQLKVAVINGMYSGLIKKDHTIVCLTGIPKNNILDSIVVLDISREFEMLSYENMADLPEGVRPEVFLEILNISIELGAQGRDGKSLGTIFVIGDHEKVLRNSRQLIRNPFRGYSEGERNVLDPELRETIKEFAVVDGAFIIQGDGILLSAGRHLSAPFKRRKFPSGLGSRHVAAAGITSKTDSLAIVLSESTGSVRIFRKGDIIMEIAKPTR